MRANLIFAISVVAIPAKSDVYKSEGSDGMAVYRDATSVTLASQRL